MPLSQPSEQDSSQYFLAWVWIQITAVFYTTFSFNPIYSNPKSIKSTHILHTIEKCSLSKKSTTLTHIFLDRIDEWELWCEHAKTTMFTWTMANKFPGTAGCKTCILTWLISIPIFKMIHHFKAFCVAPVAFQAASPIRQHKTPHQFYRFNHSISCLPKPGPIRHLIYLIMSSARSHHSLVAFQQNADIY